MFEVFLVTIALIVLDLLTGLAGAVKTHTVQSGKMREGLWHKAALIGLIVLALVLQYALSAVDLGINIPNGSIVIAVCAWIILMELVSNFENLCILNPEINESPISHILDSVKGERE